MKKVNDNKDTVIKDDYKKYIALIQKQKRMGIISKNEYAYLKAYYILHLGDK